jgi:hypothetical protein
VYSVESEQFALEQIAALPAGALPFYAELITLLETAPWSGETYNMQRPSRMARLTDEDSGNTHRNSYLTC